MTEKKFNIRVFWDSIDPYRPLYSRLGHLSINFTAALRDLANNKTDKNSDLLKSILRSKEVGIAQKTEFHNLRRSLDKYFIEVHKQQRKTTEELAQLGFDEAQYQLLLKLLSEFLIWAYGGVIPNAVKNMYRSAPAPKGVNEMKAELEKLSIEDLADNPGNRAPVLFIIDNSKPMEGTAFNELQKGLDKLFDELETDVTLANTVELYIATCGNGPNEIVNFATIDRQRELLDSMDLKCFGRCFMGATINAVLDKLEERIETMTNENNDVAYYTPWMIVLSNGQFKDDMESAYARVKELQHRRELQVYPIGLTKKADMAVLRKLDEAEAKVLTSVNGFFKDIFSSLKLIESSTPGGNRVTLVHQEGFKE